MSTALCYCPGCGEIVEAAEPCECVFLSRGTIDDRGVLHTARREPLDDELSLIHISEPTRPY